MASQTERDVPSAPHPFSPTPLVTVRGDHVLVRPLAGADGRNLGHYFRGLSARTRRQFGPHPFDQATADALCAASVPDTPLRLVATITTEMGEEIMGYFILLLALSDAERHDYSARGISLDPHRDCLIAPSVADAWQSRGVGGALMRHIMQYARLIGRQRVALLGGVYATNPDGFRFYRALGFHTVGTFANDVGAVSYDMICDLESLPYQRHRGGNS